MARARAVLGDTEVTVIGLEHAKVKTAICCTSFVQYAFHSHTHVRTYIHTCAQSNFDASVQQLPDIQHATQ